MVKLLKRLPEDMMRDELPKILQVVCNLLRARLQRIRDDARGVLIGLSTELGGRYLMYVLHVLKSSLPMRGFTAHVLGYTTYFVLEALDAAGGLRIADDSLVMVILSIVEGDLFGDVAEAKEVGAFASSYKESKRCKSYDIIRILGKCIGREEDLIRVLSWITDRSNHADTPKTKNKISALLAALRKGLSLGTGSIVVSDLVCGIAGFSGDDALRKDQLLEFALGVANDRMKARSNVINDSDISWLETIQPIAVQAISTSKRSGCVVEALRILSRGGRRAGAELSSDQLFNGPLSVSIPYAPIARAALKSAPESPIGRETLELLTHAVASKQKVLDDRTMGKIVQWAGTSSTDSFRMIKALIKSRHVLPEVYDAMSAISSAMVKSTDKTVRQLASSTVLAFLLDYPLGKKRLDHHIEFLLSNMGYEHSEGGRGAVCELLCHLARKFPPGVKKRFYDKFVFFAFARAANEESRDVRRRVVDDLLVGGLASPELYGVCLGD
jgi:U3 small nucleolar RNA-associated protein 20